MSEYSVISGSKGGKGGGSSSSQRTPVEHANTLRATSIAKLVDLVGEGPIEGLVDGLKSVYLDETPIQNSDGSFNYNGLKVTTRDGHPDQPYIPGFPSVETERDVSLQVRRDNPIIRTVTNAEADAVRLRVHLPSLTFQNKSNGDLKGHDVQFGFEVREEGNETWQHLGEFSIIGKTTSPYQKDYHFALPGDGPSWEIRMYRVSSDDPGAHISNETYWASITEIIDAKLSYPDSALVGLEADAQEFGETIPSRSYRVKGRIIEVPSNYNPETREYTGIWDGTFQQAWTDNPAWIYRDVLLSDRFGAGQQYVDKWALYEIAKYCDELVPDGYGGMEPRFTCNLVLNTRKEAFEVIDSISSIFRGMTYWASTQIMPVGDMPKDPTKLFTRANTAGDFEYSGSAAKARHSVVLVSWNDPDDMYRKTIEVVEDRDLIEKFGLQQKDVTAVGCSSRGQAHRLGKWILYSEKFETETVSFTAGSDAYDLRPGDIIEISDPAVTGERLGGRLLTTGTESLKLDRVPNDLTGNWSLMVVMPNQGIETRGVTFEGDRVTLDQPLSEEPISGAVWTLTSDQARPITFRVLSVSEEEELTFSINALKHESGKYALVEDGTPLPEKQESMIPKGPLAAPTGVTVETTTRLAGGTEHQDLHVSWTQSEDPRTRSYLLEVKSPSDTTWRDVYSGAGISTKVLDIEPGPWEMRVRSVDALGRVSPWSYLATNIAGLLMPLPPTSVAIDAQTFTVSLRPSGALPGMQWEFWRSNVSLLTENITSNAVKVATTGDLVDSELQPGTTYFYYIRGVNAYGVSDWFPVQATTANDASKVLQTLNGQITESELYGDLNSRIDLIDGPETLAGSVAERVSDEASARIDAVNAEAQARADAIAAEQDARATAISNEQTSRVSGDDALSQEIDSLTSVVGQNTSDITTEQQARADADSALANDIISLEARQGRVTNYRVRSAGNSATSRISRFDNESGTNLKSGSRSYNLVVLDGSDGSVVSTHTYDLYGSAANAQVMADKLNALGDDKVVVVFTHDEPQSSRLTNGLPAAMYRCGASPEVFGSSRFKYHGAYILVGIPGIGESAGEERYKGDVDSSADANAEYQLQLINGRPVALGGNPLSAALQAESQARTDSDSALASDITALQASVGENEAALTTEQQVRADADSAMASDITVLQTSVGDNASAITTEQQVRADADSAMASDISTLQVETGANAAALQTEQQVRADADSALATDINTVQTSLNGQISSVEQTLTSDIDAINDTLNAEYTLKLDVDGYVGGMGIANDGTEVDFAVRADSFYIADPGSQTKQIPFIVKNGNTYIKEALIENLTFDKLQDSVGSLVVQNGKMQAEYIQADQLDVEWANIQNVSVANADIEDLAVDTVKIADGAVTLSAFASDNGFERYFTYGSMGEWSGTDTFATLSFPTRAGDDITIEAHYSFGTTDYSGKIDRISLRPSIQVDGSDRTSYGLYRWRMFHDTRHLPINMKARVTGTGNTMTVKLRIYWNTDSDSEDGRAAYEISNCILSSFTSRK